MPSERHEGRHFRHPMTDGATLGTKVARYVLAHRFPAVWIVNR